MRTITCVCYGLLSLLICGAAVPAQRASRVDYSRFSHLTEQHRATCNSCHTFPSKNWKAVRKSDDAFPDVTEYPEHKSCLNCHREQFFARERPVPRICSNCHVKATPNDTTRLPFPSLGNAFLTTVKGREFVSDFLVTFPQDKHSDTECKDCIDRFWLKKDTFNTRPLTHAECFTCHNQESELAPLPPNCDSCHKRPAAVTIPKPAK